MGGEIIIKIVTITNTGNRVIGIKRTQWSHRGAGPQQDVRECRKIQPGKSCNCYLTFIFSAGLRPPDHFNTNWIITFDDPGESQVRVMVDATIVPPRR